MLEHWNIGFILHHIENMMSNEINRYASKKYQAGLKHLRIKIISRFHLKTQTLKL